MLVFVDESGDTGLKPGGNSSPYFIVTLVIFEEDDEALAADTRIGLLRRELGLAKDFEFHFIETPERIKEAFFKAIVPYNFFYFSIVINKGNLYGEGFSYKDSFYKYTSSLVFENAKQYLSVATVVLDGTGSREFKRQFASYLRKKVNDKDNLCRIKKIKIQDSRENNLIQLADMVCGAIARHYKNSMRYSQSSSKHVNFRQMIAHREIYVQFWPKNKNSEP